MAKKRKGIQSTSIASAKPVPTYESGTDLARSIWLRYTYMRDSGHEDYVTKANRCEDFFAGLQWEEKDLQALKAANRPALTINKIISTISNVMGAQIFNRTDTSFKPRNAGATEEVADALTKVSMQIGDNNQLVWVRSDVFADGIITSRGFYDMRLDFQDTLRGEVRIKQKNPKNTLIDPDADEYDPDSWADTGDTEWVSLDDITMLFGKEKAERLENQRQNSFMNGDDEAWKRDRFATTLNAGGYLQYSNNDEISRLAKNIRIFSYQWRKLDMQEHFVDTQTGDIRPIPDAWDEERRAEYQEKNPQVSIIKRMTKRIRWTVVAGDEVLHDAWGPYKHFTTIPYFPHFRRGRTIGLVENLLGPQELLNKVSSQELHVVNTTANSGWKLKRNSLKNMSLSELETRGAQTGLVLELDELTNAEKIMPNPTPQGLDRISYKAEEHVKTISGVSDYMTGFSREDVSAKSVKANQAGGSANLAKVQDNLNRTDFILARNMLDIVQEYYTEERLIQITSDRLQNKTEQMTVNQRTAEDTIVNDLTLGEYTAVITNQPDRDTFEESQFDQVQALRTEMGVQIPDRFVIQSSRLKDKAEILKAMEGDSESPEAKAAAELKRRAEEAEVADKEASVQLKQAQAAAAMAKATDTGGSPEGMDAVPTHEQQLAAEKLAFEKQKFDDEQALKRYEIDQKLKLEKYEIDLKYGMDKQKMDMEQGEKDDAKKQEALKTALKSLEPPAPAPAPEAAPAPQVIPPTEE